MYVSKLLFSLFNAGNFTSSNGNQLDFSSADF